MNCFALHIFIAFMSTLTIPHSSDSPTVHFWRGTLNVGFILSAPGTFEAKECKPAFGVTGTHLDRALKILKSELPTIFLSTDRYEYRITNAYSKPLSIARGDSRTEAPNTSISNHINVERLRDELNGCRLVVLCGDKAHLLKKYLSDFPLVIASHTSSAGLNSRWPKNRLGDGWAAKMPSERTNERIRRWASEVNDQVRELIEAGKLTLADSKSSGVSGPRWD